MTAVLKTTTVTTEHETDTVSVGFLNVISKVGYNKSVLTYPTGSTHGLNCYFIDPGE